jgi:hypothetical protein
MSVDLIKEIFKKYGNIDGSIDNIITLLLTGITNPKNAIDNQAITWEEFIHRRDVDKQKKIILSPRISRRLSLEDKLLDSLNKKEERSDDMVAKEYPYLNEAIARVKKFIPYAIKILDGEASFLEISLWVDDILGKACENMPSNLIRAIIKQHFTGDKEGLIKYQKDLILMLVGTNV